MGLLDSVGWSNIESALQLPHRFSIFKCGNSSSYRPLRGVLPIPIAKWSRRAQVGKLCIFLAIDYLKNLALFLSRRRIGIILVTSEPRRESGKQDGERRNRAQAIEAPHC